MKNSEFKFEPIWVSALSFIALFFVYKFYTTITVPGIRFDFSIIILALIPLSTCALFLPMGIKMIKGIPAVLLTHNQLIDNVVGIAIDWQDVQDIRITGVQKPFISITLKDTTLFYSKINNPLKRLFLRFIFLLSPGDVSINLAMVAGSNESIVAITRVYWSRYYGHND